MNTHTEQRWLAPGQPQWMWMTHGAHLVVQHGAVVAVLPEAWWADATQATTLTLPAGTAHVAGRSGWVRLNAVGSRSAEVLCVSPAPLPRRGLGAWCEAVVVSLFGARARRLHHLRPLARFGGDQAGERC
ncbi:MAG: hypothetical protein ABW190_02740 [Rhizobacter sp.]